MTVHLSGVVVLSTGTAGSIPAGAPYFLAWTLLRDIKWEAMYVAYNPVANSVFRLSKIRITSDTNFLSLYLWPEVYLTVKPLSLCT